MSLVVFIISGFVIVPIFISAIFLLNGKGAFMIAGYNTMSADKKAQYDEKALCRFIGWLLIVVSFCMILFTAGMCLELVWVTYCGAIFILFVVISGLIYANTGGRFHINNAPGIIVDGNESQKPSTAKAALITVAVVSALAVVAVSTMLYYGEREPVVRIFGESIQIKAMYGLSVDFADIASITLAENSMSDIGIGRRTNGYGGFGGSLKGHFKSDDIGETLLFIQSKSSPTIRIERVGKEDIYISFRDSKATINLYNELLSVFTQ